jgi:TrmH family RNA methyltransferase
MITKRKLLGLQPSTRLRKIQRTLQEVQEGRLKPHPRALMDVLSCLEEYPQWPLLAPLVHCISRLNPQEGEILTRTLHRIRTVLLDALGESREDWDFGSSPLDQPLASTVSLPGTERLQKNNRYPLAISLYLEDLRSPFNLGSLFRTAEAFGVQEVFLSPFSVDPLHQRARRSAMGAVDLLTWSRSSLEALSDKPVVALELGGEPLSEFSFPDSGVLLIGSEELGLSAQAKNLARVSGGIVTIPLAGSKRSLNVAVAAGIALHAWAEFLRKKGESSSEE